MTDDLETPVDETADTPAPDDAGPSSETPADDEQDVGALKRALDREREERRAAKEELRRIREDEDARRELLAQWGMEVVDDDPPDDEDDDEPDEQGPVRDPRVDEILAERAQERFERDLMEAVGDRDLDKFGREWIAQATFNTGNNPEALKKATAAWFEREDKIAAGGRESYRQSKKAPTVASKSGKAATAVKDFSSMTREEVDQWMVDRARDLEAQT